MWFIQLNKPRLFCYLFHLHLQSSRRCTLGKVVTQSGYAETYSHVKWFDLPLTHCCAWPAEGRSDLHNEWSWVVIWQALYTSACQFTTLDRSMWRSLRLSAGQAQQWVSGNSNCFTCEYVSAYPLWVTTLPSVYLVDPYVFPPVEAKFCMDDPAGAFSQWQEVC